MMRKWKFFILPMSFGSLPFLFYVVGMFHKPDHADPFWLPMFPVYLVSTIPNIVASDQLLLNFSQACLCSVFDFGLAFACVLMVRNAR